MNDHRHISPGSTPEWPCDRVRNELEAWALGALEPEEMAAVERHVAACQACSEDAKDLSDVASMLPFSLSSVSPSAGARRALMSRIADDQIASGMPARPVRMLPVKPSSPEAPESRKASHWSQMLVAPLAIALLVMTLWSFELRGQVDEGEDQLTSSATTAMLPDGFQAYTMQSECEKCESTGKLLADPETADALMVAWGLDPSQVHQVWCEEGDGEKVLVASLNVSEAGEVVQPLVFDQPIAGYSQIYVMSRNGDKVEIKMGMTDGDLASPMDEAPKRQ